MILTNIMGSHQSNIIILGGGISGLTAGWVAKKRGMKPIILEAHDIPGGVIQSKWKNGFLLEYGPNTVLSNTALLNLIKDLNIPDDQLLTAPSRIPRFVQWRGNLFPVPLSPLEFIKSDLLSPLGKLRILKEPFISKFKGPQEESLWSFTKRRLGTEVTERLVSPFVSGVWAGDASKLSAQAAFPKLDEWEQNEGSLFKGMRKSTRIKKNIISFKEGLSTLPLALGAHLKDELYLQELVTDLKPGWVVKTNKGTYKAPYIIVTLPTFAAAQLFQDFDPALSHALEKISYAPIAVIHMTIDKKDLRHQLDGFGYLVAPAEKSDILGCLWNSSIFNNHAPEGKSLLTVFMGGAMAPEKSILPDDELISQATQALKTTLKPRNNPTAISIHRYKSAIPQYNLGHTDIVRQIKLAENKYPGLYFAGNYMGGIAVGDVIDFSKNLIASLPNPPNP